MFGFYTLGTDYVFSLDEIHTKRLVILRPFVYLTAILRFHVQ